MDTSPVFFSFRSVAACSLALVWLSSSPFALAQNPGNASSKSTFGANSYLSDGATQLMLGNYKRGVELTRMGLGDILSQEERVASLSNLCAGYVGLKEYEVAVVFCNRSLAIEPLNWRALQNRAAANAGIGNFAQALKDVELGLTLNPNSDALKLTLAIVRDQGRRVRSITPVTAPPPAPPVALPPARS